MIGIIIIIINWILFLLGSQLLIAFATSQILLEVKRISLFLSRIMFVVLPLVFLLTDLLDTLEFILGYTPIILAMIYDFIITYRTHKGKLINYDETLPEVQGFLESDPEVCVVFYEDRELVVPMVLLRSGDLIVDEIRDPISVTYCVLCNSSHAYFLPKIDGNFVEIDSNRGEVLNGNKILTDTTRTLVWQQFDGKPLNEITTFSLEELNTTRMHYRFVKDYCDNPFFVISAFDRSSFFFFNIIAKLVESIPRLAFTPYYPDKRLPMKMIVEGIELEGNYKAYPQSQLDPKKLELFEDELGGEKITVINNHGTIIAFLETGLEIDNKSISREGKSWDLYGFAKSVDNNLTQIPVTNRVYWYIWSKFHPNTEIYSGDY